VLAGTSSLLRQTVDIPSRVPCDQVWGGGCTHPVGPPRWSHGDHPISARKAIIALHYDCPPEIFELLAQDPDKTVRYLVAGNKHCPPEIIGRLARDAATYVFSQAATHPNCPAQQLWELCVLDGPTRHAVAGNPSCPPELLSQLARNEWWKVREAVALNGSCPAETLERLLQDPEIEVSWAAAYHPQISAALRAMWQLAHNEI